MSIYQEAPSPETTASIATRLATIAIDSGVALILRAVAAGIISNAVINKTPTIFMAIAMTNAVITIKAVRTRATLTPSTAANSGSTVMLINDFHKVASSRMAIPAPE